LICGSTTFVPCHQLAHCSADTDKTQTTLSCILGSTFQYVLPPQHCQKQAPSLPTADLSTRPPQAQHRSLSLVLTHLQQSCFTWSSVSNLNTLVRALPDLLAAAADQTRDLASKITMTRIILPIVGGLLALVSGVDAKSKKDRVHLYQFTSDQCLDTPSGGNVDLERDKCVKINARSLTLKIDSQRKKWLDDVNHGKHMCAVTLYRDSGCVDGHQDKDDSKVVTHIIVPNMMEKCHTEEEMPVHWAKFSCRPHFGNEEV